jgi:alcohol dehydrogenase
MASAAGARVVMACDPVPALLERVVSFGATHTVSADADKLAASVAQANHGKGADMVLELAGTAQSVQAALKLTRTGGVLVLAGTVAPIGPLTLDPEQIVRRMLTIRGVHNYHPRDLQTALAFLAGPGRAFPFDRLIPVEFPLEEAAEAFAFAHAHPGFRVAVRP